MNAWIRLVHLTGARKLVEILISSWKVFFGNKKHVIAGGGYISGTYWLRTSYLLLFSFKINFSNTVFVRLYQKERGWCQRILAQPSSNCCLRLEVFLCVCVCGMFSAPWHSWNAQQPTSARRNTRK